ncbi:hypothetical protein BDQ12DRAFT_718256 [Crucibulum laeve]|uniref:F-box domain-containing protein n=1 Tax=Crucibulum laeve TaxID=68775 RepID=A0A5C3MID2_9AGAR|nr:hypothetical protein BDQ12DRAFT_718256 [Crucibulum laeve]
MHAFLQTQDLMHLIFECLRDDAPGRAANKTLVALALTCHEFQNLALDCLPEDLWTETQDMNLYTSFRFTRRIYIKDFSRFDFYAQRIKCLEYHTVYSGSGSTDPDDFLCFVKLHNVRCTQPLLPNLREISFLDSRHATFRPDIFLAGGPKSISLQWSGSDENADKLLPFIQKFCPTLETLDLGSLISLPTLKDPYFSTFVITMDKLRELYCGRKILDAAALDHLASLPYLRTLQVCNSTQGILQAVGSVSGSSKFSHLQNLIMKEDHAMQVLPSFAALLRRLSPLQLRSLELHLHTLRSGIDISSVLFDIFGSLTSSSRLGTMHRIIIHSSASDHPTLSSSTNGLAFSASAITPLFAFSNLVKLELVFPSQSYVDFDDEFMLSVGRAWSKLQHLQLGPLKGWGVKHPAITFNGLVALVEGCPDLEFLAFVFNASASDELKRDSKSLPMNASVTSLFVGDSIIDQKGEEYAAMVLSTMFPRLLNITGAWNFSGFDPYTPIWQSLVKKLNQKNRGR